MSGTTSSGASSAAAGTSTLSGLLSGYAARPSWQVAGVDYAVGDPSGLADPSSINMAGVSVDAASHTITISGSNVTLNGYDFSGGGGWGVDIASGASNVTIENSHFLVGGNNNVPINAAAGSGDVSVLGNTIDGSGGGSAVWGLVSYDGSGTFTAKNNAFLNAPEDGIDFNSGTMTTDVENNLFENIGTSPGSHPDPVQYVGVTSNNSVEAYNTIYQPNASGEQGVQLQAQNGSTLNNTTIDNNTIIAKGGSSLEMSYSVAVIQNPGNTINGATVDNNYIDYSGAYGPFYPPSGSNLTFAGNVDMSTGATIPNPSGTSSSGTSSATTSQSSDTQSSTPSSGTQTTGSGGSANNSGGTQATGSGGSANNSGDTQNQGNTVSVDQSNTWVSGPAGGMLFISGSQDTVDLTGGGSTVTDTGGGNTFVLPSSGTQGATFTSDILNLGDKLDLRSALAATDWNGSADTLSHYMSVTTSSNDASINLASTSGGPGTTIATISGAASLDLNTMLAHAIT
ncbi:right-handed parallel beta-helix repeat-containing protein [Rhodopila globiformis]|uniref:Right handed beta helix domain-containing protein n=1 Tax=Rhodopila globiformis TaxID=1071 RepID=A0A2S6N4G5_RHOGL|nr:right-handed parallel beta-helix repeat-containing protein [Rhodopila globiformis]PPQ29489.1 hypothetical protein CCS01_21335 [Rhodopila globiformis]